MPMYVLLFFLKVSLTGAVTLTGSSEYAVPGTGFTLKCDVPEKANVVEFYRRPDVTSVGGIQPAGGQCYNTITGVPCTVDVCSCVTSGGNLGTVFRWIIQPQTGDQGSVWFCKRTNLNLPNQTLDSNDYTLNVAVGPDTSLALTPPDTTYTRTEGDTLPDITCTADCRPDCTFVWTRPDNNNFTVTPVLSLGQLNRSENGTYRCTVRNNIGESTISTSIAVNFGPDTSIALTPPDTTYTRTEGDTLPDITCTANCRPDCTFVWTRPDNNNFTVSPVLSLGQLNRSEHGTYRCTARNVVGESTLSCSVTVKYGPSPVMLTPPTLSYTPTEGQTIATITCSADCNPVCTYSWTKGGQSHTTGSDLQLTNIQRGQTGVYRCTASNVHGSATSVGVNVTVYYGPSSVNLTPPTVTYTPAEGQTIPTITCSADCNPACTYSWTKDGQSYTTGSDLQLTNIQRGQTGVYRCTASNVHGSVTYEGVNVTVFYGPSFVSLTPQTVTYTHTEGQTIPTIACYADCNPACTYSWTKDGQSYTTGSRLQLANIQRGQTGVYRCTASNVHGSNTAVGVNVTVYYGPSTSLALSPPDTTYTRTEGDTLPDITCTADCRPNCTFVWTRPDNTNFTVSPVLSLGQLNRTEHGTYRCTARNVAGESIKVTNITVQFPSSILKLGFTTGDGNLTENSKTSLVCTVESFPPSTIQWFYNDNGTVLLTSLDVLESTYTLTNAGCLDTGRYTCSVRNSVSIAAVTRDIPINVLCKPREDPRVKGNYQIGLATSENVTMYAMFLANPEPEFNWSFQNASEHDTALMNTSVGFMLYNSFVRANVSAVSVGIRTNIQEHWYGNYEVTATNSQGNGTIRFQVVAQGKPNPPYGGSAICPFQDSAILSWRSAFDGGARQTFVVGRKSQNDGIFSIATKGSLDPGKDRRVNISISGLAASTHYYFVVYAVNMFGNTTMENEVNCTTKAMPIHDASPLGAILGAAGGSLATIIVVFVVVVIVITRRRIYGKKKTDDDTEMITGPVRNSGDDSDGLKTNVLYESSDGLKPNILYESSDGIKANGSYETSEPQPGNSSEYAVVQKKMETKPVSPNAVYAVVDKPKNTNSDNKNDLYAEVVKSKRKGGTGKQATDEKGGKGKTGKSKQKRKETKPKAEDVYENVEDIGASSYIYGNCQDENTSVAINGPSRKRNKDGLIYLDIEFKEDKQNVRNYVIHGIENRTDYADVDFTKHVDPLPDDHNDSEKPKEVSENE